MKTARMRELAARLKAREAWAVLGHVNPDGDTSGSSIALALALRALGKRAFVFLPGGLPQVYRGFECSVEIVSDGAALPFAPEGALSADVSEIERLGPGKPIFEACAERLMIDHHGHESRIRRSLSHRRGRRRDGRTGRGADRRDGRGAHARDGHMALHRHLHGLRPLRLFEHAPGDDGGRGGACARASTWTRFTARSIARARRAARALGEALSKLEMDEKKQMCWSRLTQEAFQRAGALPEDNEGIVNYLLEIRGVRFACLAEARGEGTKFSLRSKAPLNVARDVAAPLGGGGHMFAAGVTLKLPMEAALEKVLSLARAALEKPENGCEA